MPGTLVWQGPHCALRRRNWAPSTTAGMHSGVTHTGLRHCKQCTNADAQHGAALAVLCCAVLCAPASPLSALLCCCRCLPTCHRPHHNCCQHSSPASASNLQHTAHIIQKPSRFSVNPPALLILPVMPAPLSMSARCCSTTCAQLLGIKPCPAPACPLTSRSDLFDLLANEKAVIECIKLLTLRQLITGTNQRYQRDLHTATHNTATHNTAYALQSHSTGAARGPTQ
jgi:hypothetical protein